MPNWKKTTAKPMSVGVLLFDGFSNHCVANAVEPLRAAKTLGQGIFYEWQYLTLNGEAAESSSGLKIVPHGRLSDAQGDLLMVMPSYGYRDLGGIDVQRELRVAAGRFAVLAGLDTGSWLLAKAGLLNGYRATIHWDVLTSFAEAFPEIDAVRERYVIEYDRITCSGAMAAFDMVLHLIGRDHGKALALEVEQLFMAHDPATPLFRMQGKGRLAKAAVALMQANLERPLKVVEIASGVGCSQKRLEQVMHQKFGATPQDVYRRLRLNLVRRLAEETHLELSEVALRSGYQSPSAMARAFKSEFGMTASEARQRMY